MRRTTFLFTTILVLLSYTISYTQTIKEMKFEAVRLMTVIKALSKASGKNIIIDPAVEEVLNKPINVFIQKPISINEAFNIILKEYGLIAIPVNENIYKITKAGELEVDIKNLSDRDIEKIIDLLKKRISPSAEVVIDKTLRTLYIRDAESRVKKLGKRLKGYINRLIAEKRAGIEERPEAVITRVFYLKTIDIGAAKQLLAPHMTKETVMSEAPTFNALVITDKANRIKKYEEVLKDFLVTAPATRKPMTQIFYLKYISPKEFIKMIEPIRSEAGLVLTGGAVKVEKVKTKKAGPEQESEKITPILEEFNAVMITDYPEVIERIKERFSEYISDVPPQVKIEARILEVRKEVLKELGLNWSALLSNVKVPQTWSGGVGVNIGVGQTGPITPELTGSPGGILTLTYSKGIMNALNLRISAYERIGKIKAVAKPSVVTINGKEAIIEQGKEIPYKTTIVASGATSSNIIFKKVVLKLKVRPIISPDGRILMDIDLIQDTPGVETPVGPAINTKAVNTKVIVKDGDTVVIGGIIDSLKRDTTDGVAGLVRVPILKWLFGQEVREVQDIELLIFITPTLIAE